MLKNSLVSKVQCCWFNSFIFSVLEEKVVNWIMNPFRFGEMNDFGTMYHDIQRLRAREGNSFRNWNKLVIDTIYSHKSKTWKLISSFFIICSITSSHSWKLNWNDTNVWHKSNHDRWQFAIYIMLVLWSWEIGSG